MAKKIAVIGGGVGGLCGAIRLAKMGYDVSVYEKNATFGGKMNQIRMDGFVFDTGPTLITMPFVFQEFFDFLDRKLTNYLQLVPVDPACRYFFPNGKPFDAASTPEKLQANIAQRFPTEIDNYKKFIRYAETIFNYTHDVFIQSPIHEPAEILKFKNLIKLFSIHKIDAFRTVHQAVSGYFDDPELIQLFDRYTTYNGSDPYQAPATLNVIPYVELALGSFYIKNGLYEFINSLLNLAREFGVKMYPNTRVHKIHIEHNKVRGVIIGNSIEFADAVLCNADVVETFNTLVDGYPNETRQLNALEPSLSGMIFYWGMKGTFPDLVQHNIFYSQDYAQEFRDIFQHSNIPDDPTIYVSISAKQDKQHAPAECENWFVLVNTPYNNNQDWSKLKNSMRQKIFKKLKNFGLDAASNIITEKVYTPQDIQTHFGGNRGSIYGISSNNRNSAFQRPANRHKKIKGLFFAGGSSHPGGGVPMCVISGKIAANLIYKHI